MTDNSWEPLDTKKLLEKQRKQKESITSGNVGSFEVPLGTEVLRPPLVKKPKKKKKG